MPESAAPQADMGQPVSSRGLLHYSKDYTGGVLGREIRGMVAEAGIAGAIASIARLFARNATAYLYYSIFRPHFVIGRFKFRAYGGLDLLRAGNRAIPIPLRWANVLSKLDSERALEVPLGIAFSSRPNGGELLEVGNVLSYYWGDGHHTIIDKYEEIPGVLNIDAIDFRPKRKFGRIVSISTIEHIGFDEPDLDGEKPILVLEHLKQLLSDDGEMLLTMPLGYNPRIDRLFNSGGFGEFDVSLISRAPSSYRWAIGATPVSTENRRAFLVLSYPRR